MAKVDEIVYECHSLNNKRVRASELKILEKNEDGLYFIFGADATNEKKRYYKDLETLRKDFDALQKIKKELEAPKRETRNSISSDRFSIEKGSDE